MNNLKYLYLVGILIAILGLVVGIVSQIWLPIPINLLVLGLILIVIGIGLSFPKTVVTTNTMIITLSFLLILGLLNFLVVRNEVRIDFTENQVFTLSSQSQAVVSKLTQPVKVWLFQSQLNSGDLELLKNYSGYSSQFSFELVDPEIEIQLAKEFEIKSIGEVYIEYGGKKRLIQKISEIESLSEAKLTSGIQAIQSDRPPVTLYFLQGHGETELTPVEEGLSQAVESCHRRPSQALPVPGATKFVKHM